ncbi:Nitrogen assimilation regulatory protein [Anatilimnocola aggregata]|uniref:Nitrogen assimilation regulatory protein n=1 Tax=Anatilimnocola aggregata TaxID=2528021 RepID=A0A517YG04_9BACT|nr:sigma 54-interacting transcriptional regulator [Anatilimnocola aggregata]QDU29112.1 Nitrogen assimilation regulatory protein [Anatilimnocola aggregata]
MLFTPLERDFVDLVRQLAYSNPFDPDEQARIRQKLDSFDLGLQAEESKRPAVVSPPDEFTTIYSRRIEALLVELGKRVRCGQHDVSPTEVERYEDLVITVLHLRHFAAGRVVADVRQANQRISQYADYLRDLKEWTKVPLRLGWFLQRPEHSFAVYFQYQLAIQLIHTLIQGNSRPIARLKAATWHSIFPRELRLYGVLLYERMHEVTTLILGPSGTGKELVATAIGLARFVPFDPKRERFTEPLSGAFHPINLSALPRDLIESEMFGHVAGAFTGATKDREGWFEKCRLGHTVFLDELGEMDESVQVRLLRVLQNREFYRVGETEPRGFAGRVIAATNRDLSQLIADGRFREDLYFRLCSDIIRTPTLREQLDDSPEELPALVAHAAGRCLGDKAHGEFIERLTKETLACIEMSPAIGPSYNWPGNFRELEQCVRSVMVRGEYHPPTMASFAKKETLLPSPSVSTTALDQFLHAVRNGTLSLEELLTRYCSLIQSRTGNVAETTRRLKKHRLTVQGRIDPNWVEQFRQ